MKGIFSYTSARFAERLVTFLILPILTKTITPLEYAVWTQSIIVAGVLMPVILLKFETSLVQFFPDWNNQNKKQNSVILFMLLLIFIMFSLFTIIALIFDEKIAHLIFGNTKLSFYIPLIIGLLLSELLFEFLIALLRVSNRIGKISIYILMKGIWRVGILVLILIGIKSSFYFAFWVFVSFQLFATLLFYILDIKPLSLINAGLKRGKPLWKKVLKFSLPLVPFIIFLMVHNFIDRFFITHFLGLSSLATYNAGFALGVVVTFIYSTISFLLYPELSKSWSNKNKNKIIMLMRKVVTAYLALTIPFLIFIWILGVDVLILLTTNEYLISSHTLFLICFNIFIFGLFQFAHYIVLLDRGSQNAPFLMAFVVVVNTSLNLFLIPKIGIFGAAVSGLTSNLILMVVVYNMSRRNINWKFPFKEGFKILLRSLIMGIVIWQGILMYGNDIKSLILIMIIAGAIYLTLDLFGSKNSSFFSVIKIKNFKFKIINY